MNFKVYVSVIILLTLHISASISVKSPPWRTLDWKKCVGKEKTFKNAAVATDNPLCSSTGRYILEKGGSAIDATVAILACQTVVDCHLAGFGGGGRMLIYKKAEGKAYAAAATAKIYSRLPHDLLEKQVPLRETDGHKKGGAFVGIPGTLAAAWESHQRFGVLPWKDLFEPAVEIAVNGFPMGAFMRSTVMERPYPQVLSDEMLRAVFVDPRTGDVKEEGSIIKLPILAKTLEEIASGGGAIFYNGSLAQDIVDDINEKGGFFGLDDMRNYRVKWDEPFKMDFTGTLRDITLYNAPGQTGGFFLQSQLMLFDGYNSTKEEGSTMKGFATLVHRQLQALRVTYCFPPILGRANEKEKAQLMNAMRSSEFLAPIRNQLRDDSVLPFPDICEDPDFIPPSYNGTSSFSIVAPNGDAVTMTTSIHNFLGSTVMGRRTGITFNDAVNDFSDPSIYEFHEIKIKEEDLPERLLPNATAAGMQTPSLFVDQDGNLRLITGASGGGKIPLSIAAVARDVLLLEKSLKVAIDFPRLYTSRLNTTVTYSTGYPEDVLNELRERGNTLLPLDGIRESCVQAIEMNDGLMTPYSDPRRQGCTDGF